MIISQYCLRYLIIQSHISRERITSVIWVENTCESKSELRLMPINSFTDSRQAGPSMKEEKRRERNSCVQVLKEVRYRSRLSSSCLPLSCTAHYAVLNDIGRKHSDRNCLNQRGGRDLCALSAPVGVL